MYLTGIGDLFDITKVITVSKRDVKSVYFLNVTDYSVVIM